MQSTVQTAAGVKTEPSTVNCQLFDDSLIFLSLDAIYSKGSAKMVKHCFALLSCPNAPKPHPVSQVHPTTDIM
ncbi:MULTISPECIES: hypothetical protein [unclassified Microcoleus]|uniref:hypothetical protein n=1 Tax=unclassified Microcoleus TaxID=2642155 RepID=UPI002FD509B9